MTKGASEAVIVTGASAGLGEVFSRRYAARGHALLLVARRRERLESLAEQLRSEHGVEVHVLPLDLSERDAAEEVLQTIDGLGWSVEVLINNAGFGQHADFVEIGVERNLGQVHVNVEALTHLCALFAPGMVERRRGRILNIASMASFQPGPRMAVYCATKAYVLSFSEALAHELAPHGVRVTASCPGATKTEFSTVARGGDQATIKGAVATAEEVVDEAIAASDEGRVVVIHGLQNQVMAMTGRFLPRSVVRRLVGKMLED